MQDRTLAIREGHPYRGFDTYDRWQRVILHLNEFCCILRDVAGICHDHCYRLTNEPHFVYRQRIIRYRCRYSYRKWPHLPSHINPGNDSYDTWNLKSSLYIKLTYGGVRIWAPDNSSNFASRE